MRMPCFLAAQLSCTVRYCLLAGQPCIKYSERPPQLFLSYSDILDRSQCCTARSVCLNTRHMSNHCSGIGCWACRRTQRLLADEQPMPELLPAMHRASEQKALMRPLWRPVCPGVQQQSELSLNPGPSSRPGHRSISSLRSEPRSRRPPRPARQRRPELPRVRAWASWRRASRAPC